MTSRPVAARAALAALAALALVSTAGCKQLGLTPGEGDPDAVREQPGAVEARHIVIQHVLIAHKGAKIQGVTRTVDEAEVFAGRVFERAQAGADMAELVRLCSDDREEEGVYEVANFGVELSTADELDRQSLSRAFGRAIPDAAFAMEPGAVRLIEHHEIRSPLGWHIVKRLR